MERSHGEEGVDGKCRKEKGHDLWYSPGSLAEFRRIPMGCLSAASWAHKTHSGLQRLAPNSDYWRA